MSVQLTILRVYRDSEELEVQCESCKESYLYSRLNRQPDYCMMCGAELASALYTNPKELEKDNA